MFKIMPYFRIAVPDWNCLTGFAMGFVVIILVCVKIKQQETVNCLV